LIVSEEEIRKNKINNIVSLIVSINFKNSKNYKKEINGTVQNASNTNKVLNK
jgi:hypothetical protein